MMTETCRLLWTTVVTDVARKTLTVGGRMDAEGKSELLLEDAGWYIRLGNMSLWAGDIEPPFKKGDRVRIIIEKERESADQTIDC
jgi:hypothetical protein